MEKSKLTKADESVMRHIPKGWFEPYELTYVRCPAYRCERLEKAGILESRVVGKVIATIHREYRKKEVADGKTLGS